MRIGVSLSNPAMMMIKSKWRFFSSCKAPSSFATEVKRGAAKGSVGDIHRISSRELSFLFDGVGVVVVGDEQDFFYLEGHEFLKYVAVALFPLVYFVQVYFFHDVLFCTKLKICWRNDKRKIR